MPKLPDQLPEQLPATVAELTELAEQAEREINKYLAIADAGDELSAEQTTRLGDLTGFFEKTTEARATAEAAEKSAADELAGAIERARKATAPKPEPKAEETEPEPEADESDDDGGDGGDGGAEVVAEAEAATEQAAQPELAAAAVKGKRSFAAHTRNSAPPAPAASDQVDPAKRWALVASAPNFAERGGQLVDTAAIAEGICSTGQFTGINPDARTVLATMERPDLPVHETAEEFYADLDRITSEIPDHGKVNAGVLVAAGGWCAPSEQEYDFCPTRPAIGLLSFPEKRLPRGGVIFPAEPDFSELQTGFHFTEPELEAVDGEGVPTAIKNIVEIPCPPEMVEYRLEAIGWGVKSGILQKRAWPELVKKFLDEFMVEHQYRISAKSLLKVLAVSGVAKVVPTDAVLGATTSILNGLHVRARNIQIQRRTTTVEGIAPIWFRDVLRSDLASRDGLDVLNVTDADVDRWLADRGIYLQYEGRWQSLTTGQPGHEDTSWWPDHVDVVLYPAGTFWRALNNVITLGVQMPFDLVRQNRQLEGFVEDEFQVGKRCDPSHLIRIPLCVNGAVGAREEIVCTYGTEVESLEATITITGTPDGGTFEATLAGNSTDIAYNANAAAVKTALVGLDDGYDAADFTVTGGPGPGTPWVVTYPSALGALTVDGTDLTGGTIPDAAVS
ncbi:Uncharacterised protein [Mycolicibacterium vanbaalenii]|uniref:Major capsid protein n=1 Tax=Mycolicibacterium vanbaalenii TaxID=110539 RepID=A0A5S9R9H9_MYCVN|nr:major capsid protein [Mycolicibacterium vanbaalenii]CAA0134559.1 Uncharacterised protein [Mycolicibacterium vanbaalenii]